MSFWKLVYDQFEAQGTLPNRLSIAIGEKIRQAREEAKMSQEEVAQAIYRHRPALSEMERGKMYPDIETLIYLAHVFQKPLLYFIPNFAYPHTESGNTLTDDQQELLVHFGKLDADGKRLAIALLRTHANFNE
jgi:transcriptional regulator with XRE-family HTH domain